MYVGKPMSLGLNLRAPRVSCTFIHWLAERLALKTVVALFDQVQLRMPPRATRMLSQSCIPGALAYVQSCAFSMKWLQLNERDRRCRVVGAQSPRPASPV